MTGRTQTAAATRMPPPGFAVFPCSGKRPLVRWRAEATTDPGQIGAWTATYRDPDWGIACGRASRGLLVFDLDGWDADRAFTRFVVESSGERFPRTACALTGSDKPSFHFYTRLPEGVVLGNGRRGLPDGVDVRGEGGYVIAPGSHHRDTGRPYRWILSPDHAGIVETPTWLIDLLIPKPARTHARYRIVGSPDSVALRVLRDECQRVAGTPPGARNQTAFARSAAIGNLVAGGELDLADAAYALVDAAVSAGLHRDEAEQVVIRGLDCGIKTPRRLPTRGMR